MFFRVSLMNLYIALVVVESELNPNYSYARIPRLFKCSWSWLCMTFSSTFEKELKIDIGL